MGAARWAGGGLLPPSRLGSVPPSRLGLELAPSSWLGSNPNPKLPPPFWLGPNPNAKPDQVGCCHPPGGYGCDLARHFVKDEMAHGLGRNGPDSADVRLRSEGADLCAAAAELPPSAPPPNRRLGLG